MFCAASLNPTYTYGKQTPTSGSRVREILLDYSWIRLGKRALLTGLVSLVVPCSMSALLRQPRCPPWNVNKTNMHILTGVIKLKFCSNHSLSFLMKRNKTALQWTPPPTHVTICSAAAHG